MFGLENQKKQPFQEFSFELEKELKNPTDHQKYKELVEKRIQKIKEILRSGQMREEFDVFGILLHGYTSLLKVMARVKTKK